uniref:G-protein coupled receptors family 2 profile 2 domain-containing protein n=1 Tax=Stomoxys calcitrans TaxID=35570 RepID=A0A1I8Q1J5_STOCA
HVNRLSNYNYNQGFRNQEWEVDSHVRGCVCGTLRYCVKLCCERGEFFNEATFQCERIPEDYTVPQKLYITLEDESAKEVDIYEYFTPLVGTPCEKPESLSQNTDSWDLTDEGTLHVYNDDVYLNTVNYCLSPFLYDGSGEYVFVPLSCPIKNEPDWTMQLNTYAMAISVIFLLPTVLIYLLVEKLRGNMRGKLLICYLISLIGSYTIISIINISGYVFDNETCSALGFACYFFFVAAFLWLNVLCFDIWINFKDHQVNNSKRKLSIRFLCYTLYAWGTALLMTLVSMLCQWSDWMPMDYKPGIGDEVCWLDTEKWSAGIYFYWPNLIIIIINIGTFVHLSLRIYRIRKNLGKMTQKQKFFHENGVVILRLFIVMGISWIMDIASFSLRKYSFSDYLFTLTDFCNAIQGVTIFALFVLKRNVYDSVKKSVSSSPIRKSRRSSSVTASTHFSKLSTNSYAHTSSMKDNL